MTVTGDGVVRVRSTDGNVSPGHFDSTVFLFCFRPQQKNMPNSHMITSLCSVGECEHEHVFFFFFVNDCCCCCCCVCVCFFLGGEGG